MSLIGIIFAKADLKEFKSEVRGQLGDLRGQQGALASKMDEVMAAGRKDALEIMRQMMTLHERVAVG